jgi:hypothetical protein
VQRDTLPKSRQLTLALLKELVSHAQLLAQTVDFLVTRAGGVTRGLQLVLGFRPQAVGGLELVPQALDLAVVFPWSLEGCDLGLELA